MVNAVCAARPDRPDMPSTSEAVYALRHAMWCVHAASDRGMQSPGSLPARSGPCTPLHHSTFPAWSRISAAAHVDGLASGCAEQQAP
jgi:hypothetical protein